MLIRRAAAALAFLAIALPARAADPWTLHADIDYDLGSPPGQTGANTLDLYVPANATSPRPVVIYVHGGAWAMGDKGNVNFKPDLFTGRLGYVLASLNYRLSPYPRWEGASPITHASPADPPAMLVVQNADSERIGQARAFALALGQDPDVSVFIYDKTHQQLNRDLGSPDDTTTYSADVSAFVRAILG